DRHYSVLMHVPQRRQIMVGLADDGERLLAGVVLEVVAGVRDHAEIEADLVVQPQYIVDGGRTLAAPERRRLLALGINVGMPVHARLRRPPWGGCGRSAASSTSVPQPGLVGSTISPFSTWRGMVRNFCFHGTSSTSSSPMRKFGTAAAKCDDMTADSGPLKLC